MVKYWDKSYAACHRPEQHLLPVGKGLKQTGKRRTSVTVFGQVGEDWRARVLKSGLEYTRYFARCSFGAVKQIWDLEPETGAWYFCADAEL